MWHSIATLLAHAGSCQAEALAEALHVQIRLQALSSSTRLDIVASRLHRFTCRLHGVASKLSKQMTYKRASVDLEYRQLSLRRRRLFWGVRGAWGSSHRFLKLEVTPATIVHPDSSIVAHDHAIETHEVSTASGVLNFEQLLQGLPAHQRAHKRRRSRCAVVDASSTCLFYSK